MSRSSTTLEALLLVLLCLLLLCAQRGQSKKYMRCELTRVMVQNYKFQKTLMSNCELKRPNTLYKPYNTFMFAQGSAWWSTRARWTPTRLPGKRTIARTMVCFRSIARTTVPRDARGVYAIWSVKVSELLSLLWSFLYTYNNHQLCLRSLQRWYFRWHCLR